MSREEVAEKLTYRVVFTKEGKDWTVVAPEVHPAHSWGPNLRSASEHIKEAIALALDLPEGAEEIMELDAEYNIDDMDGSLPSVFRVAREARHELKNAQEKADNALRLAIEKGRRKDLSIRDIATMTNVSYQRVAQIASGS
jgi:predicted RNase H-like HicB family nuclease